MKTARIFVTVSLIVAVTGVAAASKPMPESQVALVVDGVTYRPGATISVRLGARVRVEAKVTGGRRAWCAEPETYANVGRRMVITRKGEDGLSFLINGGQFRGDWSLVEEKATFTTGEGARVTPVSDRAVNVEFPDEGIGQTYVKVTVDATWRYVRKTPAGRTTKDERQSATDRFTFAIARDEGVWFSSKNVVARGTEDFHVRGRLTYIQRFFDEIEGYAKRNELAKARARLRRLEVEVKALVDSLDELARTKPGSTCTVTIMGSPVGQVLADLDKLALMSRKWKDMAVIAGGNASKINRMLLRQQHTFSANVLRSVFKNYINWGTSIPTGAADLLTTYDPNTRLTPFDLPRKVMGWWETANDDASILHDQVRTIRVLTELRAFYLQKMQDAVGEKRALHKAVRRLRPVKRLGTTWARFMRHRAPIKWRP